MQGFPVSSSGSRTVIGDSMGSRSQLYSLVALASVVVTVLYLRPVLAAFPGCRAGCARGVRRHTAGGRDRVPADRPFPWWRGAHRGGHGSGGAALDVLYGILVAIGLSILDLLRRDARPHDGILGHVPGVAGMHDVDD